jgi:hypothetical protein
MRQDDQRSETLKWVAGLAAILLAGAALAGGRTGSAPPCVTHVETIDRPAWMAVAQAATLQGEVKVSLHVASNGLVISANAVTGDPLLRRIAEDNAKTWRFAQGTDFEYQVVYEFRVVGPPAGAPGSGMAFDLPSRVTVTSQPLAPSYSSSPPAAR